jgi:DNA polymerase-3 subunit epsilon
MRLLSQATISNQSYRFMFKAGPPGEVVALDCETTGLNPRVDDIVVIAAVKIRGERILASEHFEAVARPASEMAPAAIKVHRLRKVDVAHGGRLYLMMPDFLHFIGGRPLVGYYLDFDVRMINKHLLHFAGIELPNPLIDVSRLYYERKYGDAPPGTAIDLSFAAILKDLGLPIFQQHDALNDALMTAMMYLVLRDMKQRGVRIPRPRSRSVAAPFGA